MTPSAAASASLDPVARAFFQRALLLGSFTLRSGATSDRYVDKYRASTDPELLELLVARLAELAAQAGIAGPEDVERIVAPALGAVPLATALSLHLRVPVVIVRDGTKAHGTAHALEGLHAPGDRAVLVEDIVTSGGAALGALAAARDAGLELRHALCVLERPGAGRDALAQEGLELHAAFGPDDLETAVAAGLGTRT